MKHQVFPNSACIPAILMLFLVQTALAIADESGEATKSEHDTVSLVVYKKWIGASGNEGKVEVHLFCREVDDFEPRFINRDRPDGWKITFVPADGIFCSVHEVEQDTFVADTEDCKDLLVVPGQDIECTMVNTKVVKRIDMLNRYGLGLMIAVMLAVGLISVRKFTLP